MDPLSVWEVAAKVDRIESWRIIRAKFLNKEIMFVTRVCIWSARGSWSGGWGRRHCEILEFAIGVNFYRMSSDADCEKEIPNYPWIELQRRLMRRMLVDDSNVQKLKIPPKENGKSCWCSQKSAKIKKSFQMRWGFVDDSLKSAKIRNHVRGKFLEDSGKWKKFVKNFFFREICLTFASWPEGR